MGPLKCRHGTEVGGVSSLDGKEWFAGPAAVSGRTASSKGKAFEAEKTRLAEPVNEVAIQEAYVRDVTTRSVGGLVKAMGVNSCIIIRNGSPK